MAQFPKKEEDIMRLCNRMVTGYTDWATTFPNADLPGLQSVRDLYGNWKIAQICKEAWAHMATDAKDAALDALVAKMESELKQSEVDTAGDPGALELIGWSDREPPEPRGKPGQPRRLELVSESGDTIELDWKAPATGSVGPARAYVVLRRADTGSGFGTWQEVRVVMVTRCTITNQPRGASLEYRVVAMNNAGTSVPSNSVAAVL